jgi:N-acetylglucosaminyl-diphospho-decaprenol L-rhamnosyltransferase
MSTPDLSVVVVTHNGRDMAIETLRSARAHTGALSVEWLVVDNGSTDGTPDALAAEFPDLVIERGANVGFAAGNNAALRRARGRYVLLLNPDVEIRSGTLERLVDELDSRPRLGAASVIQRGPEGALLYSIRRYPSAHRQLAEAAFSPRWPVGRALQEAVVDPRSYEREHEADWLVGAFLVLRAAALAEIGLLDERFFLYSEETDLCFRLRQAGWTVAHLPVMTITHHQGGYGSPELAAQLSYSKLLFFRKHHRRVTAGLLRSALIAGHAVRFAIALAGSLARPQLRARARGDRLALAVLTGLAPPPFPREGSAAT